MKGGTGEARTMVEVSIQPQAKTAPVDTKKHKSVSNLFKVFHVLCSQITGSIIADIVAVAVIIILPCFLLLYDCCRCLNCDLPSSTNLQRFKVAAHKVGVLTAPPVRL